MSVINNWNAAYAAMGSGAYDMYAGTFIDVLEGKVIASAGRRSELLDQVSREHSPVPGGIVVLYIDPDSAH
jgi:hypothetical protein